MTSTSLAEVRRFLDEVRSALDEIDPQSVQAVVDALMDARRDGRRVFVMGNGGSAATASHFVCDLHAATRGDRRLGVFSLTDNTSLLTALANDLGYDRVFSEQVAANAGPGDVAIVISASGDSANVVRAVETAKSIGVRTAGLLGFGGGRSRSMVDLPVVISSRDFGVVESVHSTLAHLIASRVRRQVCG